MSGLRMMLVVMALSGLAGCGGFDMGLNPFGDDAPQSRIREVPKSIIVDSDDTVSSVARDYNVEADDIIALNNLRKPYQLAKGSRLLLPRPRAHVVRRGDTLAAIAKAYKVSAAEIASLNGLAPPYPLAVGDRLRVPGSDVTQSGVTLGDNEPVSTTQTAAVGRDLPTPQSVSGSGFMWPARGKLLSRFGGSSSGTRNDGINIALSTGSKVRASENGVVAYAGNEIRGFGNLILIKHSGGWVSAYAHNQKLLVQKGAKVKRGQIVALSGKTGGVSRPQLHFELRKNGRAVDPLRHLK